MSGEITRTWFRNKTFYNVWNSGGTGSLYVPIPKNVETWKIRLTFSSPVTQLQVWDGLKIECTRNECLFENQGYNAGIQLKFDFLMDTMDFVPDLVALTVNECVYIKESEEWVTNSWTSQPLFLKIPPIFYIYSKIYI